MLSFSVSGFPSLPLRKPSPTPNASFRIDPPPQDTNTHRKFELQQSPSPGNNKVEDFRRENASGRVKPVEGIDGVVFGRNKKKGKEKIQWVCSDCGYTTGQWWGVCRSCSVSGTMKEFRETKSSDANSKVSGFAVFEDGVGSWLPQQQGELRPRKLAEVNRGLDHLHWRIPL